MVEARNIIFSYNLISCSYLDTYYNLDFQG